MRVVHANWTDGSLWLWVEATTSGSSDPADGAHPAALDTGALRAMADALGLPIDGDGAITLFLPSAHGRPLSSPRLAHATGHAVLEADEVTLARWRVPALRAAVERAGACLERLDDALEPFGANGAGARAEDIVPGPSTMFFSAASRLARSLVAEQRFVPMLVQRSTGELAGAWRPWLSDERTAARVGSLLCAMPPAARAVDDAAGQQPWPVLEDFLNRLVDASCRRALDADRMVEAIEGRSPASDPHVAWLAGLLDGDASVPAPPDQRPLMLRHVRQWIGRLDDRGADVAWRLALRLNEPLAMGDDEPVWRLTFHLQSVDGDVVTLDAEDIWTLSADVATVDGRRVHAPQELLLAELGRASRLYAPLEAALNQSAPIELELSTRQAYAFLREFRPLLLEQGFAAPAPEWWDSPAARLGMRLVVDSGGRAGDAPGAPSGEGGPGVSGDGGLGLTALVDYHWRIGVGDTTLSLAEFEKLSASGQPLVRINGRWVEIRPEDFRSAVGFLRDNPGGRMTVGEALRLAYGADGEVAGVSIVGMDATGWVSAILGEAGPEQRVAPTAQPAGFVGLLRPYQLKGLSWLSFLERFGLGACLADDMGLGKTIQVLALLLHERESSDAPSAPTLLVAPTSVVSNWRREAARFAPRLRVVVHHGAERLVGDALVAAAGDADLVVTTYALANRDQEHLARVAWGRIVLDEAQNIKNPGAKQTQALRSLHAPRRVTLTGTPVENRLSELWSIMEFCNPGYLGPMSEFKRRFSMPIERRRDQRRSRQLRALVRPFILRRLKSDPTVTADLPAKLETKEHCHLTPEQAALYEAAVKGMLAQVDRTEGIQRRGVVLATLIKLKQICNHPGSLGERSGDDAPPAAVRSGKAARLMQMLEEIIAAGDQALVFTQFRRMGHMLASMIMHDLDREAIFLHGGTPARVREQMVDRFQKADGSAPVFLLSLKAGGLGMNLTAATHVFHYDRWWNPAVENQATDRAHRIGQTRTVHVHKFIVGGTLEERIDQMIEQKTELAESIIASGERWLTELSTSQLRDLLTLREGAVMEEE